MDAITGHGNRGPSICRCVWLVSVALTLAACAADNAAGPTSRSAASALTARRSVAQVQYRAVSRPKRKPTSPVQDAAATKPQPEAVPAAAAQVAPVIPSSSQVAPVIPSSSQVAPVIPSSSELIGLDQPRTAALLGPAAETDSRSPAAVWRYKSGRCELDLVFYMEMRSGRMRSLHSRFKGDAASPEQQQACLKSIIEENRPPGPS